MGDFSTFSVFFQKFWFLCRVLVCYVEFLFFRLTVLLLCIVVWREKVGRSRKEEKEKMKAEGGTKEGATRGRREENEEEGRKEEEAWTKEDIQRRGHRGRSKKQPGIKEDAVNGYNSHTKCIIR